MDRLPNSDPSSLKRIAKDGTPILMDSFSGELIATQYNRPLGVAHQPGRVHDFYISVQGCGRDDDNHLSISGELYINGTTCLTTQPSIGYVSGEVSQQKTTRKTGDTAIVQAVIDGTANEVSAGDCLSYDLIINSQASPDVKLYNPTVVVVIDPRQ